LFEAAKTGALKDAFSSLVSKENHAQNTDLVVRARRNLLEGVKNGQLTEVVQSVMAKRHETEDMHPTAEEDMQSRLWRLRAKTATALIDAMKSDQLEDAIKAMRQQKQQQQTITVDALRAQVARTLAVAVDNGQLKAATMAMKSAKQSALLGKKAELAMRTKAFKARASKSLVEASHSTQLEGAVKKCNGTEGGQTCSTGQHSPGDQSTGRKHPGCRSTAPPSAGDQGKGRIHFG